MVQNKAKFTFRLQELPLQPVLSRAANPCAMNVCFLMYPWESITPASDSTLRLIHECVVRGHRVALTTSANLTIRDSTTMAFCRLFEAPEKASRNIELFHRQARFREQMLPLAGFDVLFMRANPPLDNLALNFLDSVKDDVFIVNSVQGLREANNKLYTAAMDDPGHTIIPRTYVSKNKDYLLKVIRESSAQKMILKPLNGFGGSGVIVLERGAMQNVNSLLDFYISGKGGESNYVILQDYVEGAEQGDVRVLMLHGEPIGAMRRVPAEGDARSNVHAGGSVHKHVLTRDELRVCRSIGPKLVQDGLYFVGIDLIGGKLIEVNVLSPGGIVNINRLNRVRLQTRVIDWAERMVDLRASARSRRDALRKTVAEA
jgi:glutathione synthase